MALNIRTQKLHRSLLQVIRYYSETEKSIYEKHEAGPQPRKVYGQFYPEWRKPWIERQGEWKSKLAVFVEKNPNPEILNYMQNIPNLSVARIKEWWVSVKTLQEIENQKYLPERMNTLGANLGAIHFFVYRHCAVRLKGSPKWICGDPVSLKLPDHYVDGMFVEAIDAANFHHNGIRYEGIQNLSGLNYLKWLSLRNNKKVDVWCLDRIAGQNGSSLEYLDIRGCQLCAGGVLAIARMSALKFLVITDPGDNMELQAAISILEEEKPGLLVKAE